MLGTSLRGFVPGGRRAADPFYAFISLAILSESDQRVATAAVAT